MKLTKQQRKLHNQALAYLEKDTLTLEEKWFVIEHFHEGAEGDNSHAGAFFTPWELARDFAIDVSDGPIVDLCAGIGILSFVWMHNRAWEQATPEITCIERNPYYVEIGKKILPEAKWICADVFDVWQDIGTFWTAISNPPFGRIKTEKRGPNYSGKLFEYKIMDIASQIADHGTFIMPQQSAGFKYSGAHYYQRQDNRAYTSFVKDTGLHLDAGCGVDTSQYKDSWKSTSVMTEIVCCDFNYFPAEEEAEALQELPDVSNQTPSNQYQQLTLI